MLTPTLAGVGIVVLAPWIRHTDDVTGTAWRQRPEFLGTSSNTVQLWSVRAGHVGAGHQGPLFEFYPVSKAIYSD